MEWAKVSGPEWVWRLAHRSARVLVLEWAPASAEAWAHGLAAALGGK